MSYLDKLHVANKLRRPTENIDKINDLVYAIKHCKEPAYKVGLKLELRRIVRDFERLPDATRRLVETVLND